ncbi:MAG: anaerobic ribonucleoside-triphosphate reductase activating protein [Candidatus Bathyarchaeota archaeon]|jgi:pyruvate formate lyase activating enzyme
MEIKGFIDVSFVDWDGKISAVIFLPNCNFRCPFCHNFNLVLNPEKAETIPFEQVKKQLERHKGWIDGVCITGGEPTLHADLPELCSRIKKMGFQVKLDTNGTNPALLKELLKNGLIDYVAIDVKASLTVQKYAKACGVNTEKLLENVKESIEALMESNIDYEFRTTVVPTLHDLEDIKQVCSSLRGCRKYVLQKFDVSLGKETLNPGFMKLKPFTDEEMNKFLATAQQLIPAAKLR